jgi:mannitol/fructose-specific phosphotransferase system IIA component (Ntr-type)
MAFDTQVNTVAPGTLADFTSFGLIVPELRQRDTAGIISELSQVLQREGFVPDVLPFYHGALNGELLSNSASPCGIAFPHTRSSAIKRLQFAFGRTPQPVAWGANGLCRVQLVFLLAVPATDAAQYLHLLASLARLERQPSMVEALRAATGSEAILEAMERIGIGRV